jgi:hypothetical protein
MPSQIPREFMDFTTEDDIDHINHVLSRNSDEEKRTLSSPNTYSDKCEAPDNANVNITISK